MRILAFLVFGSVVASTLSFTDEELHHHTKRSIEEAEEWYLEQERIGMESGLQSTSRRSATKSTPESREMDKGMNVYDRACQILQERHNISEHIVRRQLRQATQTSCTTPFTNCQNSRYRTFDGSCNNPQSPSWGMANTPQGRLMQPTYGNGNWGSGSPRGNFPSSFLPNSRFISTTCLPDFNVNHQYVTNMVPQFGQFLDHDISITPEGAKQCCAGEQDVNCWPIDIPGDDYFYSQFGRRCMDFTRSTACISQQTGKREQMNMNTAFIDGSQIYGSAQQRSDQLRSFQQGQLTTQSALNGFLPTASQLRQQSQGTFFAGDNRINEMPGLIVMHNLFLKEHNRVASELQRLTNGRWSDQQIYQEARRIVGAELQQITYNEYLPILLGDATMRSYNLYLPQNGFSQYNPAMNPTILNEFTTAAYRFGHTMVQGIVRLMAGFNRQVGQYNIGNEYFQARQVTQSNGQGYDWILTGLMANNAQSFDPFVTTGMTNQLFAAQGAQFGGDLVARNIQRGRDHGLPNYNLFRQYCNLPTIDFNNNAPPANMDGRVYNVLRKCYRNANDVDVFVGSLHETPVNGGLTGQTFNCIKAIQFQRLKDGDRFFFTHGSQPGSFTQAQLQELRRRTLGDIICQNSQQESTQRNVFLNPANNNPITPCTDASRSRLNLGLFVY